MPIVNITKNKIIGKNYKLCDDTISKSIGLMFSKKKNRTLILKFNKEKIISLHMLFVFYPIDVLFLNKSKIVVDQKERFNPFTFYKSKKKAMYAVEMSSGIINKTKTTAGDRISF